jgi:hypothetical protein
MVHFASSDNSQTEYRPSVEDFEAVKEGKLDLGMG